MHDPYVSTYLGNRFYLTRPHIDDVAIEDIAHGLAYQCRFNVQTREFYSVAQHSVMVMNLVSEEHRLAALLHDAAEAYLGDMVKPLKNLFPAFSEIEAKVMMIVGQRFGVELTQLHPSVKWADLVALATEKRDLMPNSTEPWAYLNGVAPVPTSIWPMPPEQAKIAFLEAFAKIQSSKK